MGPMEVPADAYYGASSQRAVLNFPVSGLRFSRPFIRALGLIKASAARVNAELGLLDKRLAEAIQRAAGQAERAERRLRRAQVELSEVALGGTAVGTGVNTHPEFAARTCSLLARELGLPVHETDNHFQAQSTLDAVLEASGSLRTVAVGLMKIASAISWLGSGPRAGLGGGAPPPPPPPPSPRGPRRAAAPCERWRGRRRASRRTISTASSTRPS